MDDCCPEYSGQLLAEKNRDSRVTIIHHASNQGVGGAVMSGYRAALTEDMDVIVKVDGDGQIDPSLIPDLIAPILAGDADYSKGNRFFDLDGLRTMPRTRLIGNAALSFMSKLSTGYWNIFDPTNGFTAIHRDVALRLPLEKISRRYFFESDMLFRLNILRAVVVDVPMAAQYDNEVSSMNIRKIAGEFLLKHLRNFWKRVFYNYYLRDMSLASIELPLGVALFMFGTAFGSYHWWLSMNSGLVSSAGTVMLSALPIILGLQFVLAFLSHDIRSIPSRPLQRSARPSRLRQKMKEFPDA